MPLSRSVGPRLMNPEVEAGQIRLSLSELARGVLPLMTEIPALGQFGLLTASGEIHHFLCHALKGESSVHMVTERAGSGATCA